MRILLSKLSFLKTASKTLLFLLAALVIVSCSTSETEILVFSKTEGFRHGSIESGVVALEKMGKETGFSVTATEDSKYFEEDSLKQYATVVFLNTTKNYSFKYIFL